MTTTTKRGETLSNAYQPARVSPPGETLQDVMGARGLSLEALAERSGYPEHTLALVLTGEAPITLDLAVRLDLALGMPAAFWRSREALYRESLMPPARKRRRKASRKAAEAAAHAEGRSDLDEPPSGCH